MNAGGADWASLEGPLAKWIALCPPCRRCAIPPRRPAFSVRTQRALKVFVTGGNGFIGSVVVRLLHAAGHTVRVLVRPAANTRRIDAVPHECVVGDVRNGACCGGRSKVRTP